MPDIVFSCPEKFGTIDYGVDITHEDLLEAEEESGLALSSKLPLVSANAYENIECFLGEFCSENNLDSTDTKTFPCEQVKDAFIFIRTKLHELTQ